VTAKATGRGAEPDLIEDVPAAQMLTTAQVAELLGLKPSYIRVLVHRGDFPPPDESIGGVNRWKKSTVQHWKPRPTRRGKYPRKPKEKS
jgi:excisionase family DNA binding protein